MTNREVVAAFLGAYQSHRADLMASHLDPQAVFHDLAFRKLTGARLRAMWTWFCKSTEARDAVQVPAFEIVREAGDRVHANYQVSYETGGRPVRYTIRSEFRLRDGRIVSQTDTPAIPLEEFARMAAGTSGYRLARLGLFRIATRIKMCWKLRQFMDESATKQATAY